MLTDNKLPPILDLYRLSIPIPIRAKSPYGSQALNSPRVHDLCVKFPKLSKPPKCTTFTLFPRLPPELRNRVWRFAAHQPRGIPLSEDLASFAHFEGQSMIPAVLQVTSE